jgi:hypothetical protein
LFTYADWEIQLGENTMTWAEEIVDALEHLGGVASLSQKYDYIEKHTSRALSKEWEATVRNRLESHCATSANFKGTELFYTVEGLGRGVYGLVSIRNRAN